MEITKILRFNVRFSAAVCQLAGSWPKFRRKKRCQTYKKWKRFSNQSPCTNAHIYPKLKAFYEKVITNNKGSVNDRDKKMTIIPINQWNDISVWHISDEIIQKIPATQSQKGWIQRLSQINFACSSDADLDDVKQKLCVLEKFCVFSFLEVPNVSHVHWGRIDECVPMENRRCYSRRLYPPTWNSNEWIIHKQSHMVLPVILFQPLRHPQSISFATLTNEGGKATSVASEKQEGTNIFKFVLFSMQKNYQCPRSFHL